MNHRLTLTSLVLLISCMNVSAQSSSAVPVPSQFATAHTVFLASACAPGFSDEKATAGAIYATVYQSLAASGRYRLVAVPADADLSMVLTIRESVLGLEIYDVKTHTLLWVLDEPVWLPTIKNMQASAELFINDLNTLASNKMPGDVPPPHGKQTKARVSDNGKK
jgi:hypothetical protein